MSEAKEKDRILAQIKAFKQPHEIAGLSKFLYDFEQEGHVKVWRDEQVVLISERLTQSGKDFLDSGGYSAKRRLIYPKVKSVGKGAWAFTSTITSGLIIAYLSKILGWI